MDILSFFGKSSKKYTVVVSIDHFNRMYILFNVQHSIERFH
jgi:hypothetical protein